MQMYLLDTSVLVDYLRKKSNAASFLNSLDRITLSLVSAGELYQGARNRLELRALDQFLKLCTIEPVTPAISFEALELLRTHTLSAGLLILDALIAATALSHGYTLVTANQKHFRMIKKLSLAPWPRLEK